MPLLEDRIDALYQLTPHEFTAARDALAASLTRAEAASVKRLKKPPTVPWAVNQLYWYGRRTYERIMKTGQALRTAEIAALHGKNADVRTATNAHRTAIRDAVQEATALAAKAHLTPNAEHLARMLEAISLAETPPTHPGRFTAVLAPSAFEALAGITPAKPATPVHAHADRQHGQQRARERREAEAAWNAASTALERAHHTVSHAREVLAQAEATLQQAEVLEATARTRRNAVAARDDRD